MSDQLALPGLTQRWRAQRDSYRPAGEPIRTAEYDVAEIADDTTARAFIEQHHYSRSYPAARVRIGLYHRAVLVGVAVFSQPMRDAVLRVAQVDGGIELGRFVLLDSVAANGETWMLGRCFEILRRRGDIAGVVSFSDPVARTRADGSRVFPGHVGTIYQAFNGAFLGRSRARTLRLLPDGSVLSDRALSKLRARDRGWRYVAAHLVAHGAPTYVEGAEWIAAAIAATTRPMKHAGCYRYAWRLQGPRLVTGGIYPKKATL